MKGSALFSGLIEFMRGFVADFFPLRALLSATKGRPDCAHWGRLNHRISILVKPTAPEPCMQFCDCTMEAYLGEVCRLFLPARVPMIGRRPHHPAAVSLA